MNSGIYQITNTATGCRYVGSAKNIKYRWTMHRRQLNNKTHHSKYMQRSWHSHGPEVFKFTVLLYCDVGNLIMYEQRCLDALKPEYNSAPIAGSMLGFKFTEESKLKLSVAAKRTRNFTGHRHSDESKAKISLSRKGKGGGQRSAERRARISAALKGRSVPDEMKSRISATLMGHKQSPEQIEKRMKKIRGRKMPPGFAEAASKRMKGVVHSPEVILKIRMSRCKIPDEVVRSIRLMAGSSRKISIDMNLPRSTVTGIRNGKLYDWVP